MTGQQDVKFAGFWIRFAAELIDSTILTIVSTVLELVILGIVYWAKVLVSGGAVGSFSENFNAFWFQIINAIAYMICAFPYYVVAHHRYGTTLGKRIFRIYVVPFPVPEAPESHRAGISLRQSVIRCLGYIVSYLPLSTGYIMAAFHPEKRALHDLMAGTVSIRLQRTSS